MMRFRQQSSKTPVVHNWYIAKYQCTVILIKLTLAFTYSGNIKRDAKNEDNIKGTRSVTYVAQGYITINLNENYDLSIWKELN